MSAPASHRLKIGLSACFSHADATRPLFTGKTLPSVSGYSGGGRTMIEAYEKGEAPLFEAYALGLKHKHILINHKNF
jgi:N-acetyl-gamma-glutamylphosphate reductase